MAATLSLGIQQTYRFVAPVQGPPSVTSSAIRIRTSTVSIWNVSTSPGGPMPSSSGSAG